MKEIVLKNGFKTELPDDVMDNMELVDALADAEDDDPLALLRICKLIFGNEKKKELYDSLRNEEGRVPVTAVSEAVKETFEAFKETGKN